MKILTAPTIDYYILQDELVKAGILKKEDVEEDSSYLLGLLFADNWSYDCYLKLYLAPQPMCRDDMDFLPAFNYLSKCNEIRAYLREKAPGYPFILIET